MTIRASFIAITMLLAMLFAMPATGQTFPAATGQWVIDQADILPPADEAALNAKLGSFEKANGHQLIVVIVNSLEGYDVADYGYRAGRHYNPGTKEKDDGALLLIAPNDRRLHIAVGYGLEPILTDAYSSLIINQAITPRFKAGDMVGGLNAGVDEIIKQISLPPEEARARAEQVQQARESSSGDGGAAIFWILIFLFFILPIILSMMRGNRGRRYGNAGAPVIIWGPGFGSGYGGGGFGGGFGGGGGGFSGGGGGFGGGGASGGW